MTGDEGIHSDRSSDDELNGSVDDGEEDRVLLVPHRPRNPQVEPTTGSKGSPAAPQRAADTLTDTSGSLELSATDDANLLRAVVADVDDDHYAHMASNKITAVFHEEEGMEAFLAPASA